MHKAKRLLSPFPGQERQWRILTHAYTNTLFAKDTVWRRLSCRGFDFVGKLPAGPLWQALWQGRVGVHWAFWSLFIAPIFLFSMAALLVSYPLVLGVIDMMTVLWVVFATVMVWRAGLIHTGWAFTPNIYRLFMLFYAIPLAAMIIGIFLSVSVN
jgi:hypothetical protein